MEDNGFEDPKGRFDGRTFDAVRPRTLKRDTGDMILLLSPDIFSVSAWTGMMLFAMFLWTYRDELMQDLPISGDTMIMVATV